MVGAKRARTAETPKQPSPGLRLRASYFYPTNQAENREHKRRPKVRGVPGLLEKEAGVQNRHLNESESSVRRPGPGEVPLITEARYSPRNPWT